MQAGSAWHPAGQQMLPLNLQVQHSIEGLVCLEGRVILRVALAIPTSLQAEQYFVKLAEGVMHRGCGRLGVPAGEECMVLIDGSRFGCSVRTHRFC